MPIRPATEYVIYEERMVNSHSLLLFIEEKKCVDACSQPLQLL